MLVDRVFLLLLLLQLSFVDQANFDLKVQVIGGKANKGNAIISLFDSEDKFLKSPMRIEKVSFDNSGNLEFVFSALPSGTYAISAIYDEDDNGELNTNFFGIPTELVGFSNNAKGRFGPPSFKKAAFELSESMTVSIRLGKAKE